METQPIVAGDGSILTTLNNITLISKESKLKEEKSILSLVKSPREAEEKIKNPKKIKIKTVTKKGLSIFLLVIVFII